MPVAFQDPARYNLTVRENVRLGDEELRTALAGKAALLISHRFSTVRRADRIYALERGRVAEEGTHEALMALRGRYARLCFAANTTWKRTSRVRRAWDAPGRAVQDRVLARGCRPPRRAHRALS